MFNVFKNCRFFFLYAIFVHIVITQPLLNQNFHYRYQQMQYDAGMHWENLSSLGPIRHQHINQSISYDYKSDDNLSFSLIDRSLNINGLANFLFRKNYYAYIGSEIIINYNGSKSRNQNAKINYSGLGFENNWLALQIGKGYEDWGAGNNISLALSEKSEPYEYFMLSSDYGNLRVKYIHGFLETISDSINRYLNARGLEWSNKRSLVLGISETLVYSGSNRSFDIGYFNPIATHLEVEMNDRLNFLSKGGHSNAVWQIHLDWLIKKRSRLSFNYLFDEFVLDPDIENNKINATASSIRYSFALLSSKEHMLNFFISNINIGTPTFRHGRGSNNFVNNGIPLGWEHGSDGKEIKIGVNHLYNSKFLLDLSMGSIKNGQESITARPYDFYHWTSYLKNSKFPSGETSNKKFLKIIFSYLINANLWFLCETEFISFEENRQEIITTLNIEYDFDIKNGRFYKKK